MRILVHVNISADYLLSQLYFSIHTKKIRILYLCIENYIYNMRIRESVSGAGAISVFDFVY